VATIGSLSSSGNNGRRPTPASRGNLLDTPFPESKSMVKTEPQTSASPESGCP
jgi:hypothetical protein